MRSISFLHYMPWTSESKHSTHREIIDKEGGGGGGVNSLHRYGKITFFFPLKL